MGSMPPAVAMSSPTLPQINITNVLLPQTTSAPLPQPPPQIIGTTPHNLEIPGFRDIAVQQYTAWQQSMVSHEALKIEFQKACDIMFAEGLDLEQVHMDQDPDLFVEKGVIRGIALRFVGDIYIWAEQYKDTYKAGEIE